LSACLLKFHKCSHHKLILAVFDQNPGNPGVIEFYEKFALELNELTGFDVIGLSHTGHLYDNEIERWEPTDVSGQVTDKVKFIENYFMDTRNARQNFGEAAEIFFVGHSFGCFCILEMLGLLSNDVKGRVKQAYLMFPMVERMVETPSGKSLHVITTYLLWLVFLVGYLVTWLPAFVKRVLVNLLWSNRIPGLHSGLGILDILIRFNTGLFLNNTNR
jgi:hypothetical protein